MLAAESAATLLERDRPRRRPRSSSACSALAREAMGELRALVFELRPASLEAEGLPTTLRKHVDVLRRVSGRPIELRVEAPPRLHRRRATARCSGSPRRRCRTRCATPAPTRIEVRLSNGDGRLVLAVADDGAGFDPARRAACARGGSG